jgi:hypothetical protein
MASLSTRNSMPPSIPFGNRTKAMSSSFLPKSFSEKNFSAIGTPPLRFIYYKPKEN